MEVDGARHDKPVGHAQAALVPSMRLCAAQQEHDTPVIVVRVLSDLDTLMSVRD